jgi:dTMP kinase
MVKKLIVFEGIDGSGKSTQIKLLQDYLKNSNQDFFIHKYPTAKAKKIKDFINFKLELSEDEAFFEYIQDIASEQKIIEKELENAFVICDRYVISTLAYQSLQAPLDKRIQQAQAFKIRPPDLIFWLDIEPKAALERKLKNKLADRFESDLAKLNKIRQNYSNLYQVRYMTKNWIKLDALEEKKKIFSAIKSTIAKLLG